MLKVNNKNNRTTFEHCTPFSNVSIVDFEQAHVSWVEEEY